MAARGKFLVLGRILLVGFGAAVIASSVNTPAERERLAVEGRATHPNALQSTTQPAPDPKPRPKRDPCPACGMG